MLNNKYDQEIERLMGEEGLTHAEAMAKARSSKKKSAPPEGSDEEESAETPEEEAGEDETGEDASVVDLPAALAPGAKVGKEIDVSVTGIVKSIGGGMVTVEINRMSGSSRDPMPSTKLSPAAAR